MCLPMTVILFFVDQQHTWNITWNTGICFLNILCFQIYKNINLPLPYLLNINTRYIDVKCVKLCYTFDSSTICRIKHIFVIKHFLLTNYIPQSTFRCKWAIKCFCLISHTDAKSPFIFINIDTFLCIYFFFLGYYHIYW